MWKTVLVNRFTSADVYELVAILDTVVSFLDNITGIKGDVTDQFATIKSANCLAQQSKPHSREESDALFFCFGN